MCFDAPTLVKDLNATTENIAVLADYLGFEIKQVESIQETFAKDTIFAYQRPENFEGIFAYATTQENLTEETRANQFKTFFSQATQAMIEKGETSSEVDFIIVIGKKVIIIFDSADYRKRLVLTSEKLSRDNSKYLAKLEKLKSENIQEEYKEDEDFGDILLPEEFKAELFRFSISEDEQFLSKTKILRLNFWKKIQEDDKCKKIIRDIFFKPNEIDEISHYYGDIISAVLDTLVLRYVLVRILEGRFGYQTEEAKKKVSKIGLGTSLDKALEDKAHFTSQRIEEIVNSRNKTEQLSLFDNIDAPNIENSEISEIRDKQSDVMETIYGGDLYVSDIAKAVTQIEKSLSEKEYALAWNLTSSSQLDFDLADITPGTIGEQYEQTLKMSLTKDSSEKWEYNKDNSEQRALGAFYTNAKITDYIIDITLGKKLKKIKQEVLDVPQSQKSRALRTVLNLKIADITSGGGTFLAGAVRKLGDWYSDLEKTPDIKPYLNTKDLNSMINFQKYAVNHIIYGVDVDLKALIVSSFALTLESLGDSQDKLPELIGKTLINQNSVISLVPESQKTEWFNRYKEDIKELLEEKKKWISKKSNRFAEKKVGLQKIFGDLASDFLASKKFKKADLQKAFEEKHMEVLEFNIPEVFFDSEGNYTGGFDVIFGNPPYIQLQKKEVFSDIEKEVYKKLGSFQSYKATGDIYALYFERGMQLLKQNGYLGFITSNKYLRAGYGKSLRNYFLENTNPYLLVNLGSNMFGGAIVDTSILALEKSESENKLEVIDLAQRAQEPKKRIENMSDYIEQNKLSVSYKPDESWTILSPIEQSIKTKIEAVGTPLKDWDISINYGIKTGFNEAFIISGEKRQELLDNCQSEDERERTAQLIRPILRGRDIKRYSYEFANLYLICTFPAKQHNIDDFPAVRNYLLTFGKRKLAQSGEKNIDGIQGNNARKKTNNKWFETQDSIAYWDDFNKPKIVYQELTQGSRFALDENGEFILNNSGYLIVGENLRNLLTFLNSPAVEFAYKSFYSTNLGESGVRWLYNNIINLPIPKGIEATTEDDVNQIYGFTTEEMNFISSVVNSSRS